MLWIAVAVAIPLALLVLALATRPPASSRAVQSPLIGKVSPAISASTIDGKAFQLADTRGKWVVLNFFATWCVPCVLEHDDLVRFQAAHEADGDVTVVAVVYSDSDQAVREFRGAKGGSWPMLSDPKGRVALDFGVAGVPESFLIDPNGVVATKILGGIRDVDLERLLSEARARIT
ncbi:MAG: TlpA family protein disulfide reductase [Pseudonocardiaceae bacterium]